MGKGREPQIILKTDEPNLVLKVGARGNSSSSQAVGMRTKSSSRTTSPRLSPSQVTVATSAERMRALRERAPGRPVAWVKRDAIPPRLLRGHRLHRQAP
jgi:hypothetical protein